MSIQNSNIKKCIEDIEAKLSWGVGINWTTRDFNRLSDKIYEETTVKLSVATLKRIWGKVTYHSNPTVTTLDILAQFLGHENWRSYENILVNDTLSKEDKPKSQKSKSEAKVNPLLYKLGIGSALLALALYFIMASSNSIVPNPNDYTFTSKKMETQGLPNSVIFKYDASAADVNDTVIIQQSWDERLRSQVSKTRHHHTTQYYYPGFFKAKLIINNNIVKQHSLFIKTDGWLTLVDFGEKIPFYFKKTDVIKKDGNLYLSPDQILAKNIKMFPSTPWTHYYHMEENKDIDLKDFSFHTRFKNTFNEGVAICQTSIIRLKFSNGLISIPVSILGCVSQIAIYDLNGANPDPSKLGVDFSEWVDIKVKLINGKGKLLINDFESYDLNYSTNMGSFRGIAYEFQGTGMVDFLSFRGEDNGMIWEENFD